MDRPGSTSMTTCEHYCLLSAHHKLINNFIIPQASSPRLQMTPAGLEPAIPGSVGRCLIHWATGPAALIYSKAPAKRRGALLRWFIYLGASAEFPRTRLRNVSSPGVEPGLSRLQRDVLTTRLYGPPVTAGTLS